jgi:hypothetical protein
MTSERFDDLTRTLASTASRRRVLKGLAASMAAALLPARVLAGGGNSACAHFCNQMFPPGAARDMCVSDAAHGTGPCYVCGPGAPAPTAQCGQVCCADDEVCVDGACQLACDATGGICLDGATCCSGVCSCGGNQEGGHCHGPFCQGFETGTVGWYHDDAVTPALQVCGVFPPDEGSCVALAPNGPSGSDFTRWGGYSNVFPSGGYTTSVDVYLDVEGGYANDTRFDFTSAINGTDCNHRRDFAFNAGYYNDTDATGTGARFVISASNNTGRGNSSPKNSGRDPFAVAVTGWYTFKHQFSGTPGNPLSVQLSVSGPGGSHSWTLSDPSDIIGAAVGGNRYGWFANQEFPTLAYDRTARLDAGESCPFAT